MSIVGEQTRENLGEVYFTLLLILRWARGAEWVGI